MRVEIVFPTWRRQVLVRSSALPAGPQRTPTNSKTYPSTASSPRETSHNAKSRRETAPFQGLKPTKQQRDTSHPRGPRSTVNLSGPLSAPHQGALMPIVGTPSSSRTGTCCRRPPRSSPRGGCTLPATAKPNTRATQLSDKTRGGWHETVCTHVTVYNTKNM